MKPTGSIRRVDALGRIALPKDVRSVMNIAEAEPMEIFPDPENGRIILKRYLPETHVEEALRRVQYKVWQDCQDGHISSKRAGRMTEAIATAMEACENERSGDGEL